MSFDTLYMLALDYAILQALAYALIRDWLAAHPLTVIIAISGSVDSGSSNAGA